MNITLTSLEALILKATHETLPCPDAAALEAFCAVMRDSAEGPMYAAQALAARIHSLNAREALLALTMLDRCMRRCDANFHAEVGKFRFLNEMIKLVSPKYFADRTSPEVRTRVLQLLHAWSIEYPKETKFKVAYDMLKNQGVVKETPPPLPPEDAQPAPRGRAKSAIFEDEEKSKLLQKLLQSKKPEDLQHANRLIKTMVREEERRSSAHVRVAAEVSAARDSAGLLRDMLRAAADASPDELQLIHELHASCARLRPVLQALAATDHHHHSLNDILHANDMLEEVFEAYNTFVTERKTRTKNQNVPAAEPLPATPEAPAGPPEPNESLLDFAGADPTRRSDGPSIAAPAKTNVIDELGDIFSADNGASNIAQPLKPVNLMPNEDVDLLGSKKEKAEGWNELDSLSKQLLKQSLPDNAKHMESFNGKSTKKIPMNALDKLSPKHEAQVPSSGPLFDLDFFIKKPEEPAPTSPNPAPAPASNDDVMVDITDAPLAAGRDSPLGDILDLGLTLDNTKCDNKTETPVGSKEEPASEDEKGDSVKTEAEVGEVKPLTDIEIPVSAARPSGRSVSAWQEAGGLRVRLHVCRERPRPDVNVLVVSTTSSHTSPVDDYKFQCVVPKGCKVRLLRPSGTSLPACVPFLPPPALTQVMLVARPSPRTPLHLKFVLSYAVDDDLRSEMGEVRDLPLDDI